VTRTSVTSEAFAAFLARPDTRRWVLSIVKDKIPVDHVEDVAQDALAEALKAFVKAPPSRDEVLIVWIATITRRTVADFWKKRGRRRKYEGNMPVGPDAPALDLAYDSESTFEDDEGEPAAAEPSYDPREGSVDDLELKGGFLFRWLERQVAKSPTDRETFEIVLEHGLGDKTYQTIAKERGLTLTVLSSRIFEFRKKYIPRYKRERNRAVLLLLLFGAAVVAIIVWLLSANGEGPRGTVSPGATPVLDRIFGSDLPVSHPRPDSPIEPDAGTVAPRP
jgi:DNA-directed RNA polymerase specialized sigma24 family protein